MFLRSFLQRKNKKDSQGLQSPSKVAKHTGGKKDKKKLDAVSVSVTKDDRLPVTDKEYNEVLGIKDLEARETDQNTRITSESNTGVTDTAVYTPSPQQEYSQFLTLEVSTSRDEETESHESAKEPINVVVGQQGDGTFGEILDVHPLQSDIEINSRDSIEENINSDEEEVSVNDSQIEELVKEVLRTVLQELKVENLNMVAEQNNLTKVINDNQCQESNSVDTSEKSKDQSNNHGISHVEPKDVVNIPTKGYEETQFDGKISSSVTDCRDDSLINRDMVPKDNNRLTVGNCTESIKGTTAVEEHSVFKTEREEETSPNCVLEDNITKHTDEVHRGVQDVKTASIDKNMTSSVPTTTDTLTVVSPHFAAVKECLEMIISDVCADELNNTAIMANKDVNKTPMSVNGVEDVDNEVNVLGEDNQSMYYTLEELEASYDNHGNSPSQVDEQEDIKGKSRFNNKVLACKFEVDKSGALAQDNEEREKFKEVLPTHYAHSTPELYGRNTHGVHKVSESHSDEYFTPRSSFINETSFGEMDCIINKCEWNRIQVVADRNAYRKEKEKSLNRGVNLDHILGDFVITPCQDSDTDDSSFEESTVPVPVCGGNSSTAASVEEIFYPANDDTRISDRPATSTTSKTTVQSEEEKLTDLKNWEEYRRSNMLRAIRGLLLRVESQQGKASGELNMRVEKFTEKSSSLVDKEQKLDTTEWEDIVDEGELCLVDSRLHSIMDQQASLALSLKNTEERTGLIKTQLEQWEISEEGMKQHIISLREEVEGATARQRSLSVMLNDERRLNEALQLRLSTLTQEQQQLLFNNVLLWEQTNQLELKQEHFQSVSEQEKNELEEHMKALECELLAIRSMKAGEPVTQISSESVCSVSSDHSPPGACTPTQDHADVVGDGHVQAPIESSLHAVSYEHPPPPPPPPHDFSEGLYGPVPYPHYPGNHMPTNHNNSWFPFPPPRLPLPFARGLPPHRRGNLQEMHPLPWYPNDRDDFQVDMGRGQRPYRGRGFRGGGRGRGYGRGRRGRFHREFHN